MPWISASDFIERLEDALDPRPLASPRLRGVPNSSDCLWCHLPFTPRLRSGNLPTKVCDRCLGASKRKVL